MDLWNSDGMAALSLHDIGLDRTGDVAWNADLPWLTHLSEAVWMSLGSMAAQPSVEAPEKRHAASRMLQRGKKLSIVDILVSIRSGETGRTTEDRVSCEPEGRCDTRYLLASVAMVHDVQSSWPLVGQRKVMAVVSFHVVNVYVEKSSVRTCEPPPFEPFRFRNPWVSSCLSSLPTDHVE